MRKARICMHGKFAGILEELTDGHYQFNYASEYQGPPISLSMPLNQSTYTFDVFPSCFRALLPEGFLLIALLRKFKFHHQDYFSQLLQVGQDLLGAITVEEYV